MYNYGKKKKKKIKYTKILTNQRSQSSSQAAGRMRKFTVYKPTHLANLIDLRNRWSRCFSPNSNIIYQRTGVFRASASPAELKLWYLR